MSGHLLLITIGPVQEFIAQARRTRDLWYGSHLLSELARGASRQLVQEGAQLIFPALKAGDPELEACPSPFREGGRPPLGIANRILAELPAGVDPEAVARQTRESVQRFWREELADPVRDRCRGLLADGVDGVWDEQIRTFLEFAAAWAPLGEYESARAAVERAIAGRKNLRDFAQWHHLRGSVPKSSLDGGRETVLRPPALREANLTRKYRIAQGEQLDSVGLVKRAGGDPEQFVPIVNVAMASWLDLAAREAAAELDSLREACRDLGVAEIRRKDLAWVEQFPFDASVLFPSQWESVFREQELNGSPRTWGERYVGPLLRRLGEPCPYVACLVADGDRMGPAISRLGALGGIQAHRELSRSLARFTAEVRRIVEGCHSGSLVYCGGDDVLAFLPLPEALRCPDALRIRFEDAMAKACPALSSDERPTLSVGIGVGHLMEGMGDILALGRDAQRLAKSAGLDDEARDRNALEIGRASCRERV